MISTLIIEDEIAFINTLQIMLEQKPQFSIDGVARSCQEGIQAIKKLRPDLVFLDVKLGDGTGFDVLEALPKYDFQIVFVTAYDHFALDAFRFSAFDYLLKPIVSTD